MDEGSPEHKQTPRALHLPRQVGRHPPTAPPSHMGDHRGPSVCRIPHRNTVRCHRKTSVLYMLEANQEKRLPTFPII